MKRRIITGAFLLAIGVSVVIAGGFPFWLFITVATLMVHFEVQRMISPKYLMARSALGGLLIFMTLLTTQSPIGLALWTHPRIIGLCLFVIALANIELILKQLLFQKNVLFASLRATFLFMATTPFLSLIRQSEQGIYAMMLICIVVWASDIFAYFGGKQFGKTALTKISPNKTVEGSFFGLLGGIAVSAIFLMQTTYEVHYFWLLVIGVVIFAQLGDLHESLTKRFYKVKDSSHFLPGHGGFYDRMDSFVLTAPLFFYWIHVL